jgi:hypothetical protein
MSSTEEARQYRSIRYAQRTEDEHGRLVAVGTKHGRYATYTNHGCRCEACTAAWRNKVRAARTERRRSFLAEVDGRLVSMADVAHGSASTYSNWGCRCEPCVVANSALKAEQRRRVAS